MQARHSTCSQYSDVVPPMGIPEQALCPPTNKPSFYTTVEQMQRDMPQPAWEAVLNGEAALAQGTLPQAKVEHMGKILQRDVEDHPQEKSIRDEAKAAVKQLIADDLATLLEDSLAHDLLSS